MPRRTEAEKTKKACSRVSFAQAMRLVVVPLVLFLAGVESGLAHQFRLGIHGGPSIPSIRGGNTPQSQGYSSRLGPFYGITGEWMMSRRLSLCAEINYSSQGGKRNGMQPITPDQVGGLPLPPDLTLYADFHNETIIDYLEIPVMAKLTWGRTLRVFANAGPYIGFRVRAKTVTSGTSSLYIDSSGTPLIIPPMNQPLPPVSFDATTDVKSEIHSSNVGITGGVGLETPFGPGDIVLSARFSVGLSNIQQNPEINGKNKTGAAIILLGYVYEFGSKK